MADEESGNEIDRSNSCVEMWIFSGESEFYSSGSSLLGDSESPSGNARNLKLVDLAVIATSVKS